MASLPDLNTSNVGFIAYWNAIDDGGAPSIDPEDMLTDNNINSYTLYDNGFTADYNNPKNPFPVTVRAKSDGWITAHTSREENYSFGSGFDSFSDTQGWWNFAIDGAGAFLTQNALERSIFSLQSNLSNSGTYVYNTADVNLYNYEYPNATNVTVARVSFTGAVSDSGGISATSTTTLDAAVAFGSVNSSGTAKFDGNLITDNSYGSADLLSNNFFDNTGTEKEIFVKDEFNDGVSLSVVVVWH